jgi:hypothetical protein
MDMGNVVLVVDVSTIVVIQAIIVIFIMFASITIPCYIIERWKKKQEKNWK